MLKRLMNLIRGFLGLFISGMERKNPEALLEVEKENLREQISRYNDGLASHAALCERLMSQVRHLEAEERELRAKATANLRAGNREAAGQYALRLQTVQRELAENRKPSSSRPRRPTRTWSRRATSPCRPPRPSSRRSSRPSTT